MIPPTFTLEQGRMQNKDLKKGRCFLETKQVSYSTEGLWLGAALGKFDSSDLNERF